MDNDCDGLPGPALEFVNRAPSGVPEPQKVGYSSTGNPASSRPLLSVAPMMDWTDVHFRQLARLLSRRTWLWTEMVVDKTILHTQNLDKFLWFPPEQRPLVLQLGGSDAATLAAAATKAAEYGYDEINLNCGCPSDRVAGAGCFGAALMMQPQLVADCMAAMAEAVETAGPGCGPLPLSVKCRLGVDEVDSYAQLHEFVRVVSEGSPVRHFIIHARKAFLNGLSPHQNRTVPPLRHQWAWALARDFPHLQFTLNGGLLSCHDARAAILTSHPAVPYTRSVLPPSEPSAAVAAVCAAAPPATHGTDGGTTCGTSTSADGLAPLDVNLVGNGGGIEGVMIGRGAYNDPWGCLADADRAVYGDPENPAPSRRWVIERYREYAEPMVGRWHVKPDGHADPSIRTLMRPLLNLFHGEPGCKRWKNAVDELLKAGPGSFGEVLDRSLHLIPDAVLDAPPRTPDLGALPAFQLDPQLPSPTSRAGNNQAPPARGATAAASGGTAEAAPTADSAGTVVEAAAAVISVDCGCGAPGIAAATEAGGHVDGSGQLQQRQLASSAEGSGPVAVSSSGVDPQHRQQQEAAENASAQEMGCSEAGGAAAGGEYVSACCAEARQAAAGSLESGLPGEGETPAHGSVEDGREGVSPSTSSPRGMGGGAGVGEVSEPGGVGRDRAGAAKGRPLVVTTATADLTSSGNEAGRPGRRAGQRRHGGCVVC